MEDITVTSGFKGARSKGARFFHFIKGCPSGFSLFSRFLNLKNPPLRFFGNVLLLREINFHHQMGVFDVFSYRNGFSEIDAV